MHDFDVYTLWILEQERQRALAKHLDRYAQLHQVKASQPPRQLLPAVRSCLHALALTVRALHTRLSLPRRIRQDQPFSVQDSPTLGLPDTPPVHGMARHEEQSVAAGP
jgi:hypothetical protein